MKSTGWGRFWKSHPRQLWWAPGDDMSCQQRAELSVCRRGDLQVTSHGAWPYKWCLRFSFFMSVRAEVRCSFFTKQSTCQKIL